MNNWHRSETRDVRPFFDVDSLGDCLKDAQIRLFAEEQFTSESSFTIDELAAKRLDIQVQPNLDPSKLKLPSALKAKHLSLIVSLTSPFLKQTRVVKEFSLDGYKPALVPVDSDFLEAAGLASGLELAIGVCLRDELPHHPGLPFLPGNWVAKKVFKLRRAKPIQEFDVRPRSDEEWVAVGYPAKTLFSVNYIGFINEPTRGDQSVAEVFIHQDAYRKLVSDSDSKSTRSLQTFLITEISLQLLAQSFPDWEAAESVIPKTPLASFLKKVSAHRRITLDELKGLVKKPGMPLLRAMMQSDQKLVRAIVEG